MQSYIKKVVANLLDRMIAHDRSKLVSPEVEAFDEFTPKLRETTYGSEEYQSLLDAIKPALKHHYATNDHHPEYHQASVGEAINRLQQSRDELEHGLYDVGTCVADAIKCMDADLASKRSRVRQMNLVSILEMLCDWKAASLRHNDGDIRKSIEFNQRRFGYSDELKQILYNTLGAIED